MKLSKLCVKNFRAIGSGPEDKGLSVDIEDNNIIFLIGKNNVGKSSILSSYDYFYNEIQAKPNDFHNRLNLPIEIEVIIKLDSLEAKEFQINLLPDDYPDIINDPIIHIKKNGRVCPIQKVKL